MRGANWDERTILQTPKPGGGYTLVALLEGVSLPFDTDMVLTVDGERWYSGAPRGVAIDTRNRVVVTTIMVIKD